MQNTDIIGRAIPNVALGYIEDGAVRSISTTEFFSGGKAIAIGVAGAYLPVCSAQHVPDFVKSAYKLRMAGYGKIVCIAPNDPFVMLAWSRQVDPSGNLVFLSDGNLALARAFAVTKNLSSIFVGERPERYMMVTERGFVRRFQTEPDILTLSRTRAVDALKAA
ncbi:MAG: redoxin family protein [Cucumibacter sp.]